MDVQAVLAGALYTGAFAGIVSRSAANAPPAPSIIAVADAAATHFAFISITCPLKWRAFTPPPVAIRDSFR
jgi:hypothetical protein